MKWLVGLDLDQRAVGALQMATWLRRSDAERCVGVHVFEPELRPLLRKMLVQHVVASAREELQALIAGLDAPNPFSATEVLIADSPEDGLSHHALTQGFDALLIGRVATRASEAMVRLGPVARRLVRRLPVAVAVAPPDLRCVDVGNGPVLLASDLTEASDAAAVFARKLATSLERELLVVHVGRSLRDLHAWIDTRSLGDVRSAVIDGEIVDALSNTAQLEQAAMLVCGSRRLSLAQRMFTTSVGTELARLADRTVVVVPSTDAP